MSELYRDFIDRKLTQIDNHLIDIINGLQPGPVPSIVPVLTETLIASNPNMDDSITFTDSWTNHDLIKIVVALKNDLTDTVSYYVTKNLLQAIVDFDDRLRIYHGSGYFNAVVTSSTISHTTTSNFEISEIYAVDATNCTMTVDNLYTSPTATVSTAAPFTTQDNLFDNDILIVTLNNGTSAVFITTNLIVPYKSNMVQFADNIGYRLSFGTTTYISMDEHTLSESKFFTIDGIKFT